MIRKPFDRRNLITCAAIVITVLLFVRPSTLPMASAQDANANKKSNTNTAAPKKTPAKKPVAKKSTSKKSPNTNTSNAATAAADERTYWESIRNSTNSADFRAYLKEYPNGKYVTLATNRLNSLEEAKRQAAAAAEAERKRKEAANASRPNTNTPSNSASPGKPIRNSKGIEMIWIPAGSFDMGSNNGNADEKPVHRVTIGQGFFMGKYEVTQAQWQTVMGNNPSNFKGDDNLPVENVSWNDAQEFVNKLNEMNDGYKYRMPTEAEWEYACRAGTTGDHYAQDVDDIGWYADNSVQKTHKVGTKQPNAFGLYDMSGNVYEWCRDWYVDTYNGAPADGSARLLGGEQKYRVLRGGSWYYFATNLRSAHRLSNYPGNSTGSLGFRLIAVVRTQ